jgi:hypothetical protein
MTTIKIALLAALPFVAVPVSVYAQQWRIELPTVAVPATGASARPLTAAEAAIHVGTESETIYGRVVTYRRAGVPLDSIREAVAIAGRRWLAAAQQTAIRGIHLDPSGRVGVAAEQEAYAKAQIAARLVTPGLSFGDKAFTLRTAVEGFTDPHEPTRLPIAESYLQQLEALGDSAALWQCEAHRMMLRAYYVLGRSDDVVRHGIRVMQLLARVQFAMRQPFFIGDDVYGPTVEALTLRADARERITALNAMVRVATVPSPELIAFDSAYYYIGMGYKHTAESWITGNAKVGTSAAPLLAHYWINRPAARSQNARFGSERSGQNAGTVATVGRTADGGTISVPVSDGVVRIIEIANTSCAPCVLQLYALERFKQQYPSVEPVMLTWTGGSIANRLVEAPEEVASLRKFFIDEGKLTYPIGIWAGPKVRNGDGGMTPTPPSYFDRDYPIFGKPMTYVVDGHGRIRRVFTGYDRDVEEQMRRTIEFLLREAGTPIAPVNANAAAVSSSSTTSSSGLAASSRQ